MSANVTPATWLGAGYSVDSTNHLVKLNTNTASSNKLLAQLSDTQANATTGDVRQVFFSVAEAFYQAWLAQIAALNRPVEMSLQRSVSTDSAGNFTLQYSQQYTLQQSGLWTMVAEP